MSHLRERIDKNCLNCDTEVTGRYCQNCGQENIETKETVWHLVSHFFKDITHFDGKFFSTLKYLIIKPGFISMEYMNGRRTSYVNPIRMYIFTSAFFFLIFFSFFKVDENKVSKITINQKTVEEIAQMDSTQFADFTSAINLVRSGAAIPMTRGEFEQYADSAKMNISFFFTRSDYTSKAQYDSALASGAVKHNWLQQRLMHRQIEINTKIRENPDQAFKLFLQTLLHSLPQMFFISLPLFALLLHLLYMRHKKYYYVNHSIFSIHFYIFSFISMLMILGMEKLNSVLGWGLMTVMELLFCAGIFFYLYKAMRGFYQQRRAKTIIKFLLFCLLFLIVMLSLFIIFILTTLLKI